MNNTLSDYGSGYEVKYDNYCNCTDVETLLKQELRRVWSVVAFMFALITIIAIRG